MINIENFQPMVEKVRNHIINIDTFRPLAEEVRNQVKKIVMFKMDILTFLS